MEENREAGTTIGISQLPPGISCRPNEYHYGPSISRANLDIEVEYGANLPPEWSNIIEKVAENNFSFDTQETTLFKRLIESAPSLQSDRSISVQAFLKGSSVRVRFLGPRDLGQKTGPSDSQNKITEKSDKRTVKENPLSSKNAFRKVETISHRLEHRPLKNADFHKKLTDELQPLYLRYKNQIKNNNELNTAVRCYIPLKGTSTINSRKSTSVDAEVRSFLKNERLKLFLLQGESGSGKSLYVRHLEARLWNDFKNVKVSWVPLYIELKTLRHIDKIHWPKFISYILKEDYGYSLNDLQKLCNSYRFIFILDGYDEAVGTEELLSFYKNDELNNWSAKVIVTARSQYLASLKNYEQLFWPGMGVKSRTLWREFFISSFTDEQIKKYLEKYIKISKPEWTLEIFLQKINTYLSLQELARSPLLLSFIVEILPELSKTRNPAERITRTDIYDAFIQEWFRREMHRGSSLQKRPSIVTFSHFAEKLAFQLFVKGVYEDTYQSIDEEDYDEYTETTHYPDNEYEDYFKSTELNTRIGCPLRYSQEGRFSFLHSSFLEYFTAMHFYKSLMLHTAFKDRNRVKHIIDSLEGRPFNKILFTEKPEIISFLVEKIKDFNDNNNIQVQWLIAIIKSTRENPKFIIAASNAITLLNSGGFNFHHQDLRGICIERANLHGGWLEHCDFREAKISDTNFSEAWLVYADFRNAILDNVIFGAKHREIKTNDIIEAFSFSEDGYNLATLTYENLSIWQIPDCILLERVTIDHNYIFSALCNKGNKYIAAFSDGKGAIDLYSVLKTKFVKLQMLRLEPLAYCKHFILTFSPDGEYLTLYRVIGDNIYINIWNWCSDNGNYVPSPINNEDKAYNGTTEYISGRETIIQFFGDKIFYVAFPSDMQLAQLLALQDPKFNDLVVHCATISRYGQLLKISLEEYVEHLKLNYSLNANRYQIHLAEDNKTIFSMNDSLNLELEEYIFPIPNLYRLQLSPGGNYLILNPKQSKQVCIWNLDTGKIDKVIPLCRQRHGDIIFSRDDKCIAYAELGSEKFIRLYESEKNAYNRCNLYVNYHANHYSLSMLGNNASYVLLGRQSQCSSDLYDIGIYHTKTSRLIKHFMRVKKVVLHQTLPYILVIYPDRKLVIMEGESDKVSYERNLNPDEGAAFSSNENGLMIYRGYYTAAKDCISYVLGFVNLSNGKETYFEHKTYWDTMRPSEINFYQSSLMLCIERDCYDYIVFVLYDFYNNMLDKLNLEEEINGYHFSETANKIAIQTSTKLVIVTVNPHVRKIEIHCELDIEYKCDFFFSRHGNYLAIVDTGALQLNLHSLSRKTHSLLAKFNTKSIHDLIFSRDERYFLTLSKDGVLYIYNTELKQCLQEIVLTFSADHINYVVTFMQDYTIVVVDDLLRVRSFFPVKIDNSIKWCLCYANCANAEFNAYGIDVKGIDNKYITVLMQYGAKNFSSSHELSEIDEGSLNSILKEFEEIADTLNINMDIPDNELIQTSFAALSVKHEFHWQLSNQRLQEGHTTFDNAVQKASRLYKFLFWGETRDSKIWNQLNLDSPHTTENNPAGPGYGF